MPDERDGNPSNTGTAGQPATVPWFDALPLRRLEDPQRPQRHQLPPRLHHEVDLRVPPCGREDQPRPPHAWRSYAPAWLIDANASASGSGVATNRSMVRHPTRKVMFSETTFHTAYDVSTPTPDYVTTANPNFLRLAGVQRHDGKALVTFLDRSARAFAPKPFEEQYNDRNNAAAAVQWNTML